MDFGEMSRRHRTRWLGVTLVLSLVAAACGGNGEEGASTGNPGEKKKLSIRLDWTADGSHSPFVVAKEKGWFEEEGLSVEVGEGQGSATTCQVVANQQDDVGWADFSACAPLIAKGAPIKAVAIVLQESPLVVTTKADSGISDPSDLEGHTVGVAAGGSDQQALPVFMETAGVDEDRVKVNSLDPAAKTSAFVEGRVDAIVAVAHVYFPQFEKLGLAVNRMPLGDYVTMLSYSLFVHDSMISDSPEAVEGLVRASLRAWEYTATHPEEAVDLLTANFPEVEADIAMGQLQEALALLHTENTKELPIGVPADEDIVETEEVLGRTVGIDVTGDPGTYFTDQFLPE